MASKVFLFKEDLYTFKELFNFSLTGKNLFKSGEVINSETEEVFDIKDIKTVKNKYYDILNEMVSTIGNNNDKRIKWALVQEEKERRYYILHDKYSINEISVDDMAEYLKLKTELDKNFLNKRKMLSISYDKFIIVNIGEELPDSLTLVNVGRFYKMLFFLSYTNKLTKQRKQVVKKEELMKRLQLNSYSKYRTFIRLLMKNNVIREVPTTNNTKVILINPIYANRNIRIDYTTFLLFEKDITKFLTDEEVYYLKLIGTDDEMINSYEIK